MSVNPKISVIIPVHNTAKYLKQCVDSVLHQTYSDFEVILVDNGSQDGSSEICNQYAREYPNVHSLQQRLSGVSVARNLGLEVAKGSYFMFVDSDDWIKEDMMQLLMEAAERDNTDLVVCNAYSVEGQNIRSRDTWKNIENLPKIVSKKEMYGLIVGRSVTLWNKLFLRKAIGDIRFKPEVTYCEDALFLMDALPHIRCASILAEPEYYYRINRPGSIVTAKLDSRNTDFFNATKEMYKFLKNHGDIAHAMTRVYEYICKTASQIVPEKISDYAIYVNQIKALIELSKEDLLALRTDKRFSWTQGMRRYVLIKLAKISPYTFIRIIRWKNGFE